MKMFQSLMCIAAAAMAFTGCSTEDATQDPAPEARKVTLSITADNADTRTAIDGNNKISWTADDAIEVLESSASGVHYATSTQCTLAEGKATFTVTLAQNSATDLTYAALYPASAFISDNYTDMTKIKANLPATQTPTASSFDPAADLMIAQSVRKTSQPTQDGIAFAFGRVSALAKMTLTNLALSDGETVQQVSFAAAGKNLAGRSYLDLATGKIVELGYSNSSERIVMDYSAVTGLSAASFPVWFACLPCDLAAGDAFTVIVTSNQNKTYTKTVTLADTQTLAFASGKLSTFTVDMSGIAGESIASTARVATLKYEEVSELSMAYATPVEYTNAGGLWTIAASKQKGMQLNGGSGYIQLPDFTNPITLVKVTVNPLTATRSLMLNKTNSTSSPVVKQEQQTGNTSFVLRSDAQELTTGYIKSSATLQITEVTVYTGATIYLEDIAAPVVGATDATAVYETIRFTADDDTAVSAFDGIVTAASVDVANKTLTYTVSGNTTGADREGSITLVSAANGTSTVVKVHQAADAFDVDPMTVTLGGDANATAEFTLTSDYAVGTPEVSAADKFKVEAGASGKYTVTALADGGEAEAELGTITLTRTIDSKKLVVTVRQTAKGGSQAQTLKLTNANIVAAGAGTTGYKSHTMTDDQGNTWTANAVRNYHSNATKSNLFLQIKAGAFYIKTPTVSAPIKKIVMTVSDTNKPMDGGGNTATLQFRSESTSSTVIGEATGASTVTIDLPNNTATEGYITATGAVRIWDVELTY